MFNTSYELRGLGNSSSPIKSHLRLEIRKYRFSTNIGIYILEVECYVHNFYVIQFYNRKFKNDKRKYQILTNEFKASSIIGTCLGVIKLISDKDPKASFGFIGSNTYDPLTGKEERVDNTKRWRLYKYAVENEYGPETFKHALNKSDSSYLLLRKREDIDAESLLNNILEMMYEFNDKNQ